MPITEELKNVRNFESAGFNHEQAEVLAESIEQAQASGHESLKEFIHNEINGLNTKIDSLETKFDTKIDSLRFELKADIANTSKDLLIKLFGIIFGTVGLAVTIIKLFP